MRDQKSANSFANFWHQWAKASRYPEFNEQEKELEQRALLWAFRAERQYLDMVSQKENRRDYLLNSITKFYWLNQFYLTLKMNIKLI